MILIKCIVGTETINAKKGEIIMKITPQMMAKFEKCKSTNDVLELAKKENISLTFEQAKNAFELLQSEDVSDEAMEKVTGGWCICNDALPCPAECYGD